MDYTPISAGRVLIAFALTTLVGLLPVVFVIGSSKSVISLLSDAGGVYGGLAIGVGSTVMVLALVGLPWLVVMIGRRVGGRPFRA